MQESYLQICIITEFFSNAVRFSNIVARKGNIRITTDNPHGLSPGPAMSRKAAGVWLEDPASELRGSGLRGPPLAQDSSGEEGRAGSAFLHPLCLREGPPAAEQGEKPAMPQITSRKVLLIFPFLLIKTLRV